jgi:hypothetical protein
VNGESLPVLGIIACRALEDELAHVLSEDHELKHLFIINNRDCFELSRKLRSVNRPHLLISWEDIPNVLKDINSTGILKPLLNRSRFLSGLLGGAENVSEEIIIVVNVLQIALHIDKKILRAEVCKNIGAMSQFSDSILLFYGRCGNALLDIEDPQGPQGRPCPLTFLTDNLGESVDDCIAAALGGNKQYAEMLSSHQGVGYFCIPMIACTLDYADREVKKYNIEHHLKPMSFGDMLIEWGYSKIAKIDTGLEFISDFQVESMINGFASLYHLKVVRLHGSVEIAERCYKQAKEDVSRSVLEANLET